MSLPTFIAEKCQDRDGEEKAEGSTAAPTVSLCDLCTCPLLPLLGPQFLFTHLMQELDFTNIKVSSTLA